MRTYKPLWQEGIVLSPHHLQQQGRWWEFSQQQFAPLAVAEPWGVLEAKLDGDALLNHRLKLTAARMRFADGTPIDTSIADVLPPARDLTCDVGPGVQSVVVFMGLALLDANGNNCRPDGGTVSRPRRYFREFVEVPNLFGTTEAEIAVERHALQLLFDFESHTDYLVCPVARLVRGQRGVFEVDPDWVPPCLALSGPSHHKARVTLIADILQAKSIALASRRRERITQLCKAGAPDDVAHIVNSALPSIALRAVQRVPATIPMRLENQYFALDPKDPGFARMMAARACQIYLPAAIAEASLELYAVLTSQADR